ncbi:PEP-CTERM sorting domain-containing protein [Nostoc sp. FACHB-133]|uniref:PEP-CTERM sorting domain-containing protein n=1 Tax=Nostoc sp. FACHB-133 TaxID=2692835 RepID=UPI001688AD69|nr:PEP-CTERM sorting domain-containing protein [Nostoc sp. FACHB-133]MBD2527126.1 PEP-CTERM sorting domain-containing protein [Nostoc sp. FACHB-133]
MDAKLRTFLGLNVGALSIDATEGSAIKTALNVHTFATSGSYNIGIGVTDVNDTFGSSILSLTNASVTNSNPQPVPEPLTTLASILAGGFGVMLKRKDIKKA